MLLKYFVILIIVICGSCFILNAKEKLDVDSLSGAYQFTLNNTNTFFVERDLKRFGEEFRTVYDTIFVEDSFNDLDIFLVFKSDESDYIIIENQSTKSWEKYYLSYHYPPGYGYKGENFRAGLIFDDFRIIIEDVSNNDLNIEFRHRYSNYKKKLYSKTIASKLDDTIANNKLKKCNEIESKNPMDQYPHYWLSVEYGTTVYSELRVQGLITNAWDFGTNDKMILNLSIPTFTVARSENGDYMPSFSTMVYPVFLGLDLIAWGCRTVFASDSSFENNEFKPGFLIGAAMFSGFYSIGNFNIDFPITSGKHFSAFNVGLNSDLFLYTVKDSSTVAYLEPKVGFKYFYDGKIGFKLNAGYRFWNHPTPVHEKKPYFSLELLYPLGKRDY